MFDNANEMLAFSKGYSLAESLVYCFVYLLLSSANILSEINIE